MKKLYNIVIDSKYPYVGGGDTLVDMEEYKYNINWEGIMPVGKYKMTWSFTTTSQIDLLNTRQQAGLSLNIGNINCFSTKQKTYANSSIFCGFLTTKDIGGISYFYADQKTNPPVYLDARPNEDILIVNICDGVNSGSLFSAPVLDIDGSYILILSFELLTKEFS